MNDITSFVELPITVQLAAACFVACTTGLFVVLLTAPRRNCFFFSWGPEVRFLALLVAPTLLMIWPIVLYGIFLKSRGIQLEDMDYFDDD